MSWLSKFKIILDPSLSMANFWDKVAAVHGNRHIVLLDEPLDYARVKGGAFGSEDILNFVNLIGNVLKKNGINRGDRVVIATGNRIELLLTAYACFKVGAIAVPLNYMLKGGEIKYIAENCEARFMVTDRDVFDTNIKSQDSIPVVEKWIMVGNSKDCLPGFISLDEEINHVSSSLEPVRIHRDETVAIFYTSGTTGYPKGAMMTSHNLLTTQRITAAVLPVTDKDLGLSALPSAHLMGFAVALVCFIIGAQGYFMKYFHPVKVLEAIEKRKASVFIGVPAMYSMLIHANPNDSYDLSSVRLWASGADAMPVEHIKKFLGYGGIFFEAYGQVETSPITSIKVSTRKINFKHGCVGLAVPPVRVQVWDEEGRRLPPGKPGELVVRGPNVTKGYWNDSAKNEEAFRGGWFHTGDMAYRGKYGLLYFVDRKKDVVKAGGYSVFSKEVEEEIRQHPKVDDVAIVGIPHPTKVEVVAAVCTLKRGENMTPDELLAWCRENIAEYKAPRYVEIRDEMPYGMTLKVLKRVLRDELAQKVDVSKL